jgi:negative regulator of replication initiation
MTTIQVSNELRDYLKEQGLKGETFEAVLRRLLSKCGHTVPGKQMSTGYKSYSSYSS